MCVDGPRSLEQPYSLWTLQRLADYMAEQTGIRVEAETVRIHLKAADIVLSHPSTDQRALTRVRGQKKDD